MCECAHRSPAGSKGSLLLDPGPAGLDPDLDFLDPESRTSQNPDPESRSRKSDLDFLDFFTLEENANFWSERRLFFKNFPPAAPIGTAGPQFSREHCNFGSKMVKKCAFLVLQENIFYKNFPDGAYRHRRTQFFVQNGPNCVFLRKK
jgi:hypothetical protein